MSWSRITLLALFVVLCHGNELKDYCSINKFDNLPSGLSFTKEVVTTEYANLGAFKALHCCLRGYRSIEWYKDNRAYPWPGGESHFILYPESANQTIYTQGVRASDAGRYSCRARNDTTILEGDITLAVLGEESIGYNGKPLPTFVPSSQLVPLGGSARLFCEAYLGKVELPDARNSVAWSKSNGNLTLPSHGRISQHRVSRENELIMGSYLEIVDMTLEDYGEYKCEVSNGVDEEIVFLAHVYQQESQFALGLQNGSYRKSLLLVVVVVLLLLSAGAFYARCWLSLVLLCRDKFGSLEENDGKECDALVCYHEKDGSMATGVIIPTLETRYRYKCTSLELSPHNHNWGLEIGPHATAARRVIAILSPASLNDAWTEATVATVLKQLAGLPTRTVIVATKKMPNCVTTIAKTRHENRDFDPSRLTILRWCDERGARATNFWQKLRLTMPPMRPMNVSTAASCQSVAMIVQANGKCGQQKARSRESLEVLV